MKKEGLSFDGIYSGCLGSAEQIEYMKSIIADTAADDCLVLTDSTMVDMVGYILECQNNPTHTYGARFEPVLGKLLAKI